MRRKGETLPPVPEGIVPPSTGDQGQRLHVRYAKRGRMRFASHRDIARALERALRRSQVPVAFSTGFSPHPKISYMGAAPTGVASEAEYLELALARSCDAEQVRTQLDHAMPDGLDIVEVMAATTAGGLADRLVASQWQVVLSGVAPTDAEAATAAFLAADAIEVERLTKKGRRTFDARGAVLTLSVASQERAEHVPAGDQRADAILHMIVRHTTPTVRPDDIVTALRQVADLAPPSPPQVTRLAQGPIDDLSGGLADPLAPDRTGAVRSDRVPAGGAAVETDPVKAATAGPSPAPPAPSEETETGALP